MEWYQLVVLALVQGITEFLPISSSAHLILVPYVFGWSDQGLAFDLATHLGSLVAVIAYFRRDLGDMAAAWSRSVTGREGGPEAHMAWGLILATLPAIALGCLLGVTGEAGLRLPWVIAAASIGFGLLLGWVDVRAPHRHEPEVLRLRGYLAIGLAQALALIPGSSRSGMTIMAGRWLGLTRPAAARVSFFLAIPVTAAAIAYEAVSLILQPEAAPWAGLAVAAVLSAVSAALAIHYFLRMLQYMGLMPFVVYRVVLGVVLLAVFGFEA
ncbi:undecaprenyl pyrophosphate phosphatase [Salinisphaera sp. PC39]|uniref:undecaprenyl-diphosphate phosphatase n=1 Tax=Salinisphaera sp. PC39 TaxID=1304156 RepID=UPI003340F2DC